MSTKSIGDQLRRLRLENKLPLRKVAVLVDVDVAILSKMERGERRLSKEIVQKLAELYKYDTEELMVQYLCDKVLYELEDEDLAMKALLLAEGQLKYKAFLKTDRKLLLKKLKEVLRQFHGIQKAWIYGSFSRQEDGPQSDIDVAIKATKRFSYFDLADVQFRAEKAVGRKVDIGFIDTFKPYILAHVKPDLKLIYEKR